MLVQSGVSTWLAHDRRDNAIATATQAADPRGRSHKITTIFASYSGVRTGLLQIRRDAVVIAEHYVVNSAVIPFNEPLLIGPSSAVSATLEASGTGGIFGSVSMVGYTN